MKIKRIFSVAVCVFALTNIWSFDLGSNSDCDQNQRPLVIVAPNYDFDLNPCTACYTTEAEILTGLYEGLFSYNPSNLEPEYALCTSFKISRDKKRWTFTLRNGARFSNGDKITAQSVKDSWLRLLAEPNASFSSLLDCITGAREYRTGKGSAEDVRITVRDKTTLVVHLNQPVSQLPRILCHHSVAVTSEKENVFSGPFVVKSNDKDGLVLAKNEKYWDAKSVVASEIKFIKSDETEENVAMFNVGDADWICSSADVEKIINDDSIFAAPTFGTFYLFFKIKNKPWNNVEFRRALMEAIPYDKLRQGMAIPAETLVYPLPGYPDVAGFDDYDTDDAILMMKAAREKAGIAEDVEIPLVFAVNESQMVKDMAQTLKKAWKPLGVNVIIQTMPAQKYLSAISTWNADLFYYSWVGDYADPTAFLELFRGGSSLNESRYANKEYDTLLKQAAQENDPTERYKLLGAAEEKLLSDGVIIPIYHQVSLNIIDTDVVGGWTPNALDLHPLKYLYVKKKVVKIPNLI